MSNVLHSATVRISMKVETFLQQLKQTPASISFATTMATIDANYLFNPVPFRNGDIYNEAGKNSGSCKLFSFARLQNLSVEETLQCFGDYYREDVLRNPDNSDHQNIRAFMRTGWSGIYFEHDALTPR